MKKTLLTLLSLMTAVALFTGALLTPAVFGEAVAEESPAGATESVTAAPPAPEAPTAEPEAPATTGEPEESAVEPAPQTEAPATEVPATEAPATPTPAFQLTVRYVDALGDMLPTGATLAQNPLTVTLNAGANYVVALPEIAGYRCTVEQLLVDAIAADQTLTVEYAAVTTDAASQPDAPQTVKVDDHLAGQKTPDGPYVTVRCDAGTDATLGEAITLYAQLHGFGGMQVHYQWQRLEGDRWVDVKDATASRYTLKALDEQAFGDWRVLVTAAE